MTDNLKNFSRLCIHTITTKPWGIEKAAEEYSHAGVKGISVWRNTLDERNIAKTGKLLRENGLQIVSLVRGGFFPSVDKQARLKAIDENKKYIDEAKELGSPLIVLVCGASEKQSLIKSRDQIKAGIEAVLPYAESNGIKLAVEPLHPMYADTRSAINTMRQANEFADYFSSPCLGVVVDVYHLWWDPELKSEIFRAGKSNNIFAFHVCDWLSPTTDMLSDRGIMGEGCIPVKEIRGWVEAAGFNGFIEVEIFSNKHWLEDQHRFVEKIKNAYLKNT